jgi:hypothetical protein
MLWSNRIPDSIHKTPFDLQFLKNDMGGKKRFIQLQRRVAAECMWRDLKWRLDGGGCSRGRGYDREGRWGAIATAASSGLGLMWRGREWVQSPVFVLVSVERGSTASGGCAVFGSAVAFFILTLKQHPCTSKVIIYSPLVNKCTS